MIPFQSGLEEEWKWQKLEEIVVQYASSKPIMIFKPLRALFTSQMLTSENPLSVHGGDFKFSFQSMNKNNNFLTCSFAEPIEISFALENTIKPAITFEDINLLWTFTYSNGETFTNANLFKSDVSNEDRNAIYNVVASTFIKAIQLNEHEKKVVVIKLTPRYTGQLVIRGVAGKISVSSLSVWNAFFEFN